MKNLKRLGAAVVLTFVLGLSAFAGETQTPPCSPPEPGETHAPPCAVQPAPDEPTSPGDTLTLPASNTVDILTLVDAAMNLLLLF
jgi:hypothetical protein